MSCSKPIPAHVVIATGVVRMGWGASGPDHRVRTLELPCGKCTLCKMEKARAWSIRIGHEAQLWDSNLFVTLDYDNEHVPRDYGLRYPDFQMFMRKVRRSVGGVGTLPELREGKSHRDRYPVRFFVAGEYGERYRRPHWHAILFNVHLRDEERYANGTFRSTKLESLWGNGRCVIGRVTPASAAYVAGYTQSKSYGRSEEAEARYETGVDFATGEVVSVRREFCQMSRDPGIGAWWYRRYASDLWGQDVAVQDGFRHKVPRYYLNKLKDEEPFLAEKIVNERIRRAFELDPEAEESSPERRAVREEIAKSRVRTFSPRDH